MSSFKPMLAGKCEDVSKLKFPVLASIKLDGVRCLKINGRLFSRTLKEIPNERVQTLFADVPDGSDGELILGDPTAPDAYRKTVSAVMGENHDIDGLRYFIFDNFTYDHAFVNRYNNLLSTISRDNSCALVLHHNLCKTVEELNVLEEYLVGQGHEGIMVRSLYGPYKQGRSTTKEGYLLKIKRFEDAEAEIVGFEERMHNGNEAKTNALGRTERSSHQENLVGRGDLGALIVKGINGTYKDVEFNIGTGFNDAERKDLWERRMGLLGFPVKYKFFPLGSKDKPRFPVWLGFRDKRDM